jgi:hypothetical protein
LTNKNFIQNFELSGIVFVKLSSQMRKPLVILLLIIHFFGNTEMNQVFSIPQLISHYFQHNRQDPDLSFFEFLNMHYGGDDGTTADDHEDSKLPYHNQLQSHSFNNIISSLPKAEFTGIDFNDKPKEYGGRLLTGNPSKHVLIVLQPPRLA